VVDEADLALEGLRELRRLSLDGVASRRPRVVHRRQQRGEAGLTVAFDRGIVGAGHEGSSVGQRKTDIGQPPCPLTNWVAAM
jgi:hypothetical protein